MRPCLATDVAVWEGTCASRRGRREGIDLPARVGCTVPQGLPPHPLASGKREYPVRSNLDQEGERKDHGSERRGPG
eukprot:scaffold116_cov334-Pavlova_lutheri.AAC.73